jgi:anti-sigma regulatory factor (Ser/Thr protein kinase)
VKRKRSRPTRKNKEIIRTKFPANVDFVENTEHTVVFFRALKTKVLYEPADYFIIDPSGCEKISPPAVLVLIAELERAATASESLNLRGVKATHPHVDEVLGAVGYYDHFNGIEWSPAKNAAKVFAVKETGNQVNGELAKKIVEEFQSETSFDLSDRKALRVAIVECMDNVLQHAYPKGSGNKGDLENQWWVYASRDVANHEVSICFFDQDVGIPATIRTRLVDKLPFAKSDEEIIVQAVAHGQYSRSKKPTRGKGLPTLKAFIDRFSAGELVIVTGSSMCIFRKGAEPEMKSLSLNIGGTLVVWTLKC